MSKFGICKNCGQKRLLINAKGWCAECQRSKNNGEGSNKLFQTHSKKKVNKLYNYEKKCVRNAKKEAIREKDEELYEYTFNIKPHFCEECSEPLPESFRDLEGNIIARWQYSHIISKGSCPQLRHHKDNINRLCFKCHQRWEFGDRENMKIYERNMKTIKNLRKSLL